MNNIKILQDQKSTIELENRIFSILKTKKLLKRVVVFYTGLDSEDITDESIFDDFEIIVSITSNELLRRLKIEKTAANRKTCYEVVKDELFKYYLDNKEDIQMLKNN